MAQYTVTVTWSANGHVLRMWGRPLPWPDLRDPRTIRRVIRREEAAERFAEYLRGIVPYGTVLVNR